MAISVRRTMALHNSFRYSVLFPRMAPIFALEVSCLWKRNPRAGVDIVLPSPIIVTTGCDSKHDNRRTVRCSRADFFQPRHGSIKLPANIHIFHDLDFTADLPYDPTSEFTHPGGFSRRTGMMFSFVAISSNTGTSVSLVPPPACKGRCSPFGFCIAQNNPYHPPHTTFHAKQSDKNTASHSSGYQK